MKEGRLGETVARWLLTATVLAVLASPGGAAAQGPEEATRSDPADDTVVCDTTTPWASELDIIDAAFFAPESEPFSGLVRLVAPGGVSDTDLTRDPLVEVRVAPAAGSEEWVGLQFGYRGGEVFRSAVDPTGAAVPGVTMTVDEDGSGGVKFSGSGLPFEPGAWGAFTRDTAGDRYACDKLDGSLDEHGRPLLPLLAPGPGSSGSASESSSTSAPLESSTTLLDRPLSTDDGGASRWWLLAAAPIAGGAVLWLWRRPGRPGGAEPPPPERAPFVPPVDREPPAAPVMTSPLDASDDALVVRWHEPLASGGPESPATDRASDPCEALERRCEELRRRAAEARARRERADEDARVADAAAEGAQKAWESAVADAGPEGMRGRARADRGASSQDDADDELARLNEEARERERAARAAHEQAEAVARAARAARDEADQALRAAEAEAAEACRAADECRGRTGTDDSSGPAPVDDLGDDFGA